MTDTPTMTAPLDEVRGLVDERGRYEGWLAALEERRAVTPAHVLDRVRQDYDARLRRVLDALDGHAGALRADEAALAARHEEQTRALGERRDLLAEVELRTLVGEYGPEEGDRRRQETQGAIGELEHTVAGAAAQLADVRGLLGRVRREPAPRATEAPAAPPTPDSVETSAAATPAAPDVQGFQGDPLEPVYRAPAQPAYAGQGFADAAAAAAGFGGPVGVGASAQEKTLRCGDCGAMNFPTEWYCEKCGAELATL